MEIRKVTEKTPSDDLKKKLEKIEKALMESEGLSVESYRRFQVAQVKLAGWLIEWIESQRDKLKEKKKIGILLGLLQRITDLRTQATMEYLPIRESPPLRKLRPLKTLPLINATKKMVEVYGGIRTDLTRFFYHEDSKLLNLPHISSKPIDPESKLMELNVCLGQLLGHVLGKLYEFVL